MNGRFLGLCLLILIWAISVSAQNKIDEHGVQYPTEEELATNKRMTEVLRHPTLITLRLVSIPHDISKEQPTDTPAPYKQRDWIDFQLQIGHSFSEPLVIWQELDPYYDVRPELFKDGDLVAYTKEAQEIVNRREREPPNGSAAPQRLLPGREYEWQRVRLEDWYKPLGPGHYQLTVRRRFTWDGDWLQSSPVIFDVVARKPAAIPGTLRIEMVPAGLQGKPNGGPYGFGSEVHVTVVVVNNSDQRIKVEVVDNYYGNRLQLFKDGQLVPYTDEAEKLGRSKDENPQSVGVTSNFFLDPNTTTGLEELNLNNWYGPLLPGSYRLINRHRFEIDGPWTADSAELLFEVVPQGLKK